MLPDELPQRMDTLLGLPHLDADQLRELIQQLPDPQAAAREMVGRGWITQGQFASLFPDPEQRPTRPETILVDFGDDEPPPDADCHDFDLIVSEEDEKANVPTEVAWPQPDRTDKKMLPEPKTVEAVPVLSVAASNPRFEPEMLVGSVAGGNNARRQENNKPPKRWSGWAIKALLSCTLFAGSLFAGLPLFGTNTAVPPAAGQESRQASAGDPARPVDSPPELPMAPIGIAKEREDLPKSTTPNDPPAAPAAAKAPVTAEAPKQASDAKPKPKASLYDRVRQIVRENKTEETQRLGLGDIAYQNVPNDGSIMVGMAVTYEPFFDHNIIKSVRPIYQKLNGERYDGPVCGTPTAVGDRVEAKEGYAIGGAAIKAGMGIDGMQLTFMQIGPDGLNPQKSYLSKWLGLNAGSNARMYVNDGRPIIGIAGMRSSDPKGPAFCMCLVTTKAGALANDDAKLQTVPVNSAKPNDAKLQTVPGNNATQNDAERQSVPGNNARQSDANEFRVGQAVSVQWGSRWWDAQVLEVENGRYYISYDGYGPEWDEWVGPERIRRRTAEPNVSGASGREDLRSAAEARSGNPDPIVITGADGEPRTVPVSNVTQRDYLPNPIRQSSQPAAPVARPVAAQQVILQELPTPQIPQPAYVFPQRVQQQSLETQMQLMQSQMQNLQIVPQAQPRVRPQILQRQQQILQRQQQILQQHQLGLHH